MLNVAFVLISIISGFFFTLGIFQLYNIMYFWVVLVMALVTYIVCFLLFFAFVAILSLFVSTKKKYTKPNKVYSWVVREACDYIINVLRIRVKIKGREKLPKGTNFLLVGNHISNLDPILLLGTLKFKHRVFGAISKPENIKMPIIGKVIYRACILPIDRENPRNAVATIVQAGDLLKNASVNMILYPEGTRNKTDAPLLPFKNGGFKIAQKAGVPIVVVKTINSNKLRFPFVTTVTLDIVDIIFPEDYEGLNTNEIGDKVRLSILGEELYNQEKQEAVVETKE